MEAPTEPRPAEHRDPGAIHLQHVVDRAACGREPPAPLYRMQKTHSDMLPVIRLGKGGYTRKTPAGPWYWVDVPVFVVVGRAPRDSAAKPDTSIGTYLNDEIKL